MLLTLKLKSNKKLEKYFESFIREYEKSDKNLDDEEIITYLLLGLPENYNTVVTVLETMNEKLVTALQTMNKCKKEGHKSFELNSPRTMNGNYRGRGYKVRSRRTVYH